MNKAVEAGREGRKGKQLSINNDINNCFYCNCGERLFPMSLLFESGLSDCLVTRIQWKCYYDPFQA